MLAAYFEEKIAEEKGHEVWSERDMAKLRPAASPEPNASVTESIASLARFIEETIDGDPAFYLGYIAFSRSTSRSSSGPLGSTCSRHGVGFRTLR